MRRAAVARVIAFDRVDGSQDVVHRAEAEQALAGGQEFAEPRLLGNHRPPGREIAGAAVAEPARVGANVLVAGDGEFAPRALNVGAVSINIGGDADGVDLAPTVRTEPPANVLV